MCMFQYAIETAYLNMHLEEEIHMSQIPGFDSEQKGLMLRLKKSIYGLKQSARC